MLSNAVSTPSINQIHRTPGVDPDVLDRVYLVLRSIGEGRYFRAHDLAVSGISNQADTSRILDFALEQKIIQAEFWKCSRCDYEENDLNDDRCLNCSEGVQSEGEVVYQLIGKVIVSADEKRQVLDSRSTYNNITVGRILSKLRRICREQAVPVYIGFVDLAGSQKLSQVDVAASRRIKSWLLRTLENGSYSALFRQEMGSFIKPEGDAAWLFCLDQVALINLIERVITEFGRLPERLEGQKMSGQPLYLKGYTAGSLVDGVSQLGETAIEPDAEAFTFIARVEKMVQNLILGEAEGSSSFIVSREPIEGWDRVHMDGVRGYGAVELYFRVYSD